MRKTKKQIMEEIYEYADNKEVTKSTIRKYLIEELKMSRSSAYRFLNKSDEEEIEIKNRETKKRDDIEYSEKEYEEIVSKCYEIIHSKYGLKSNDMITLKLAKSIAEDAGVNCRWLCCNILGMNTNNYDKLERGNSKTSKISIGLGFKNPEISQRVKELKHELICTKLGEKFSLQDIQDLAEEKEIPMQIILEKVFCLTRGHIYRLLKGSNIIFNNKREFIDYEYNEELEDDKLDTWIDDIKENSEQPYQEYKFFKEEDKEDQLWENPEYYYLNASSQKEYIERLNIKREEMKIRRQNQIKKYDEMYEMLLESYKELNIANNKSSLTTPNTNKIMKRYIKEIKEIITRNPKYYTYYPPKLKIVDFEKIAKDFNFDTSYLAYEMFGESHYIRQKTEESAFELPYEKLPLATEFYELFHTDMEKAIKRIISNITSKNRDTVTNGLEDDMMQILNINILERGNQLLFYGEDNKTKEEYLSTIYRYLKVVCKQKVRSLKQYSVSLNKRVKEDSDKEHGDLIKDEKTNVENEATGILDMISDEESFEIIQLMIQNLNETESREEALAKVAEQLKISKEELKNKLNDIYEQII